MRFRVPTAIAIYIAFYAALAAWLYWVSLADPKIDIFILPYLVR